MITIADVALAPYALPFERPIVTARGTYRFRRGTLLRLTDDAGRLGYGDAAPWPGFASSDAEVEQALGALVDGPLDGRRFAGLDEVEALLAAHRFLPEVAHAVELALLDLLAQARGTSLAQLLAGETPPLRVASHRLVTAQTPPHARVVKLKIGGRSLDEDEARIAHLRAASAPGTRIRLDAGGAYDRATAEAMIARFARYDVELVEQPLWPGDPEGLRLLRAVGQRHGLAIAADEELSAGVGLDTLLRLEAVDAVVLKPMFLGGLLRSRRLAERASEAGLRVIVTHALESAVGRAGALHLAAGIDGVHGLATALRRDLADLPEEDDHLPLPMGPGLGVTPVGAFDDQAPKRATPSSLELPNPLAAAAASRPHHVALVTESMAVSYAALATAAAERAAIAAGCGITPGMRVGLVGPREAEWAFWFHALGWLGAVVAPLDERAPASEQRRQREVLAVEHVIDTQAPPRGVVAPLPPRSWGLEEPRVVLATSGSTGTPRAVPLTTGQLLLSAFGSAIRLGHLPSDRWLCCLPLHHVGGLSILLRSVWYGITAVLHRRFEPTLVAEALDRGDASLVSLVPSMLERVLDARDMSKSQFVRFPSSLRAILLGGAAAPPSLLRRARALGAPVATTWGMTEAASQVATAFPGDIRLDGAVGPPLPFVAVDHQGARLALRGPLVRGHLVTGDRGVIDGEGRVVVQGRADAMIISGGENIDPSEVEQVLRRHPQVVDAAVVGLPSPIWGARPHALVMATGPITPDELAAHCRASLAGYKVPDRFELTPELPRTSLGKLARGEVARRLAATLPAELDPTFDALLGGVPQDQSDNPSPRAIER